MRDKRETYFPLHSSLLAYFARDTLCKQSCHNSNSADARSQFEKHVCYMLVRSFSIHHSSYFAINSHGPHSFTAWNHTLPALLLSSPNPLPRYQLPLSFNYATTHHHLTAPTYINTSSHHTHHEARKTARAIGLYSRRRGPP